MVKAELVKHNGSPAISINGEIFPPMMMTVVTTDRKNQLLDENYFRELGKSGIRIFFLICDLRIHLIEISSCQLMTGIKILLCV